MIFVFGSNLSGIHGAGAAAFAVKVHGAKFGVGEGMQGNCYALPTKGLQIEPMSLKNIEVHVKIFMDYARNNPEERFQVTKIGCGLGGHKDCDIAPMFRDSPQNCYFDIDWRPWLGDSFKYWGHF